VGLEAGKGSGVMRPEKNNGFTTFLEGGKIGALINLSKGGGRRHGQWWKMHGGNGKSR